MTTPAVAAPELGGSIRIVHLHQKHRQGNEGKSTKSKTEPENGAESARGATFPFFTILRIVFDYIKETKRYKYEIY